MIGLDLPRYLSHQLAKKESKGKKGKVSLRQTRKFKSIEKALQFHGFQGGFGTRIYGSIVASFMAAKSTIATNVTFLPQSSHNFFLTH